MTSGALLEIVERLEQRHDVEARHRRLGGEIDESRLAREQQHAQQVVRRRVIEMMYVRRRRLADLVLDRADRAEGVEHATRRVGQRQLRADERTAAAQLAAQRLAVERREPDAAARCRRAPRRCTSA